MASLEQRELIRLVRYGADDRIPTEYRLLSLYKVLELLFKDKKGRWHKDRLERLFAPFESEFLATGSSLKPVNLIHSLRDRCAHIRIGESLGVTHLNHSELVVAYKALPTLQKACVAAVNDAGKGKFTIGLHAPVSVL